jgi:crotonobetainyl-CoA:carnitine CoA-transferase CaiB-like acyl-CoA transferase
MNSSSSVGPLEGVRILDLAPGPLAGIGRTLRQLGADVVRVERSTRGARADEPGDGAGLAVAPANFGKRSVTVDLSDALDRGRFETLVSRCDILIEASRPGSQEAQILGAADLRARYPRLVILSVRDFGLGTYSDWQATDAVLHALSGQLSRSGIPGRAPLLPPGELSIQCAAAQGVYATLLGYFNRLQTGQGDHLELSLLEAAVQTLDPGYGVAGSATGGASASDLPRGRPEGRHLYPIVRCKDGYVRLCILAPRQWRGMFEWMGRPAEFADPAFDITANRFKSSALLQQISSFLRDKTIAEIEQDGQLHRVPVAGVLTLDEVLGSEHMCARQAFAQVEISAGAVVPFPNGVMLIDGERTVLGSPSPAVSQDCDEVIRAWSEPREHPDQSASQREGSRPLDGLRVLDLGVIVVGAEQGRLLADYGAQVIKIENIASPGGGAPINSASFARGHRNKKSLALNLREPEGRKLFLKLAEQSDVILSNFKPGTLASLDLSSETLLACNPRLILLDSSAFGATGPWGGRMGYGPLVRASSGLTARWCYPNEPDSFSDTMTVYPDHVAARVGVSGVLALLIRRLRTARGGTVSVSQSEVMLGHMADEIARLALARQMPSVERKPEHDAPWGVFPCAGDDEWCVVSIRDDGDWNSLCQAIGRIDLAEDPTLACAAGRVAQRGRVDEAVAAWLALRNPHEAMAVLQAAGVPAAAMLRVSELPAFDYFREREFFQPLHQPNWAEPILVDNAPVRAERLVRPPLEAAPVIGQHTRDIARELLSLSDAELVRLLVAKILEAPDVSLAPPAGEAMA